MRRMTLVVAAILVGSTLSGCCIFRPNTVGEEPQALGEMHVVLGAVREELSKLKKDSAGRDKIGLTVSKLTGTFRVTKVDAASGKLELGIVKPVGSAGIEASRQSTMENTIVVEFTPVLTKYEECGANQKDSAGRPCKVGEIVKLPEPKDGPVIMMQTPVQ